DPDYRLDDTGDWGIYRWRCGWKVRLCVRLSPEFGLFFLFRVLHRQAALRERTFSGRSPPAERDERCSPVARILRRPVIHHRTPLVLGIALIAVGWASGGGAAQVLFTLFSELVFKRGAEGLGQLWGTAGIGLLIGGIVGNYLGKRIHFDAYKKT